MKPGGAKAKGNSNERKTAKELAVWYYGDPNTLVRSDGIGPSATNRQDALALNDVLQVKHHDRPFPFCVELKHYKEPLFLSHLFSIKSNFGKAWKQCIEATELHWQLHRIPLLIYRTNNQAPIVAIPAFDAIRFDIISVPGMIVETFDLSDPYYSEIFICLYADFLTETHAQAFKNYFPKRITNGRI